MKAHVHETIDLGSGAFAAAGSVLTKFDPNDPVIAEHIASKRITVLEESRKTPTAKPTEETSR